MKPADPLLTLTAHFAMLSLFAMGGANAAIPEMHRLAVEVEGWMNDRQFADLFAIAQVTPGPNVIIATLIGFQVAGVAGAAAATAAICGPTCLASFFIVRIWDRFHEAPLRKAIQAGMIPVSIGLLAASAFILVRTTETSVGGAILTAATAAVGYFSKANPLWIFALAAILGGLGLV